MSLMTEMNTEPTTKASCQSHQMQAPMPNRGLPPAIVALNQANSLDFGLPQQPSFPQPSFPQPTAPAPLQPLQDFLAFISQNPTAASALDRCFNHQDIPQASMEALCAGADQFLTSTTTTATSMPTTTTTTTTTASASSQALHIIIAAASRTPFLANQPPLPRTRTGHTLHLLRCMAHVHNHLHPVSTEPPSSSPGVHLMTMLALAVLSPTPPSALLSEDMAADRVELFSMMLKNVFSPAVAPAVACDMHMTSVTILYRLVPHGELRVPRPSLVKVIRPALMMMCSPERLSLTSLLGLSSAVELIPQLFNRAFADKLVSILPLFNTPTHPLGQSRDRLAMMAAVVRSLATLQASQDCTAHIPSVLSALGPCAHDPAVVREAEKFLAAAAPAACDHLQATGNCAELAPLRDAVLSTATTQRSRLYLEYRSRYRALFQPSGDAPASLLRYGTCDELSDITLVVGRDQTPLRAHRLVLMGCAFFKSLFTNGMAESNQTHVALPDMDADAMVLVLQHLYGEPLPPHLPPNLLATTMQTADYVGLPHLQTHCEDALVAHVTCDNALDLLAALPWVHSTDGQLRPLAQACRRIVLGSPSILRSLPVCDATLRELLCADLVAWRV